jgi:ABC-type phosphate/phosphonate transport system substrate-binding protein
MSRIDDYDTLYRKVKTRLKKMLDTTEARQKIKDSIKAKGLLEKRKENQTKDQKVIEQE